MRKYARLDYFKVWCSGKAYSIPDISVCSDRHRFIQISTGSCTLGKFFFKSTREFIKAKRYLTYQQKKLVLQNKQ